FQNRLNSLKRLLVEEVRKREAIKNAIGRDRDRFANPERLKQLGDLLLANLATAKVEGSRATVTDYYDDDQEEIEIEIDENQSLQQAAAGYFVRYQKAQRALSAIEERESEIARTLEPLKELLAQLETEPTPERLSAISQEAGALLGIRRATGAATDTVKKKSRRDQKQIGRKFISTDGFEIVVGRNDRDNDLLTFRVARPQDVWLHAADYPGSHVIIRNTGRETVPHRTIIEAAELAAFYSTAKRESKVGVHYTHRKFISKPPRSKPGLVRLSSFKTLMVEPRADLRRAE
ncbi:MAG TPA: NFACT RNA binding domain-containing protein, partial [Blastocatellia bacterium]|nr:NFACT RNA binding domain-containing protein [Blastocatellia bacterium]